MKKFKRTDIPKGMTMIMAYSTIECMMSGIQRAGQSRNGVITVIYEDGTEEARPADFKIEDKTCFEIVSFVQAGRQEELK